MLVTLGNRIFLPTSKIFPCFDFLRPSFSNDETVVRIGLIKNAGKRLFKNDCTQLREGILDKNYKCFIFIVF